jgi:hypothetical protein
MVYRRQVMKTIEEDLEMTLAKTWYDCKYDIEEKSVQGKLKEALQLIKERMIVMKQVY